MTFNPNEPRDGTGKWTGSGEAATKVETSRRYKLAADNVAMALGFDANKITMSDEEKTFQLNGKTYPYAGAAFLETGQITLYPNHIAPSQVTAVTAHEIGHQKFQKWINDYQIEYKVMTEATKGVDVDTFMKPNGMLRDQWAEKFPLYQKYTEVMMPGIHDAFAVSDGITPYSEEWWKAWRDQKANTSQAMHETLAEMTAREYVSGPDIDVENERFKKEGYALDVSSSGGRTTFSARKWKVNDKLDEAELPPKLQNELRRLRQAASQGHRITEYKKKSAPEWIALYDAVNDHWDKSK